MQLLKGSSSQISRSPPLQLLMAELQARIGNLEESIDLLTELIRQEPNYFEAYHLLSSIHKFKESDEIFIKMKEIYNTKKRQVLIFLISKP